MERYHQSPDSEERLLATIVQLQQESNLLHEYIQTLLDDLAGKSLSVAYLRKEHAGRCVVCWETLPHDVWHHCTVQCLTIVKVERLLVVKGRL